MSVTITFRDRGFFVRIAGRFDKAALQAMTLDAWHDPNWDQARYLVLDLRDVTSVGLGEQDVLIQAGLANAGNLSTMKSRTATVATDPEVLRLGELFQAQVRSDLCAFRTFQDFDAAVAWAQAGHLARVAPHFRTQGGGRG